MDTAINFNAEQLIQSQSPSAPFITIFQRDADLSVAYAVQVLNNEPKILDQIVIEGEGAVQDVVVHWNADGDRSALIMNERIVGVFDFKQAITFYSNLVAQVDTQWARQTLTFSVELATEFGLDRYFKQPHLDEAIDAVQAEDTQNSRLLLYKELLKSALFVPITTASPNDPNTLIYTFPNNMVEGADYTGNLICAFTNADVFTEQIGQDGLASQKIAADYLCYNAQTFDDILGITVTSATGNTVLMTREEFKLLALISQPQRLDTPTLLTSLGDIFFSDVKGDVRDKATEYFTQTIKPMGLVRAGYVCQPNIGKSKPLFCIVVNSTAPSPDLLALVDQLQGSEMQGVCDCHVFSLSDIVAQSLENAKQPL